MSTAGQRVLVAGGGIGGMAAALALLQQGFDVEVYEQAQEYREIGAGVQISPNGSCVLTELGVFDRLQAMSCTASGKEIRHWRTGKTWPLFDLGPMARQRYGYPYLTVYRPDLLQVLTDAVRARKPDALRLDSRCVAVDADGAAATLVLENGQRATGIAVVGADGVHSRVRASLFEEGEPEYTGLAAFRALIPMASLPPHLLRMVGSNWVGPGGHVVHYPLQGGKVMNFVGTREMDWNASGWRADVSAEACRSRYADWHEDVLAMIDRVPGFVQWALLRRPFLARWSRGRATLLGDACHPTLPSFAQGANMALEDGVVLARCLAAGGSVEQALARYEQLRMERTYTMVRNADAFMPNFNHPVLADPAKADAFISSVWRSDAISDRYDWLFTYDAATVPL